MKLKCLLGLHSWKQILDDKRFCLLCNQKRVRVLYSRPDITSTSVKMLKFEKWVKPKAKKTNILTNSI